MNQTLPETLALLTERRSVRHYDETFKLSEQEVQELIELTTAAPSAWNLQHWHFLAFHSEEAKQQLAPIAYNQPAVSSSSVVIAVLGDLQANRNYNPVYGPAVEAGGMTEDLFDSIKGQVEGAYQREVYARDAAMSNASLAAMQLMLVAEAKGLSTLAMGGFNHQTFTETFITDERYVPVMLIAVGKAVENAKKRPTLRLPVDQVTTIL
ncbi:nitroreductase family protein [Exiguobacterium antarcticum]|uniref:Nitroreductase family protein n=1 Tax=Exiguobacterium antarcticum TaxID=132920 RepID=A0ABT6R215_9BACL|nr:nitroreductase family protein [Exiguobacterium antarcticum]MDI3234982.1 nitroreductase family protein [Exiguobacterium antarcticum]